MYRMSWTYQSIRCDWSLDWFYVPILYLVLAKLSLTYLILTTQSSFSSCFVIFPRPKPIVLRRLSSAYFLERIADLSSNQLTSLFYYSSRLILQSFRWLQHILTIFNSPIFNSPIGPITVYSFLVYNKYEYRLHTMHISISLYTESGRNRLTYRLAKIIFGF